MVQSVRSRLIQLTVSSSCGLPCTGKCSYKCTRTLSATFWSRERLLHMLCFQLYPRPSRPRDRRCSDWKMTVEVSAQVSQQPNTTVILTEMLIWNEEGSVKYGESPYQSQSFRFFARSSHCCKLRGAPKQTTSSLWPRTEPWTIYTSSSCHM